MYVRDASSEMAESNIVNQCEKLQVQDLSKQVTLLVNENIHLRAAITDVTDANKRWQTYNEDRQRYTEKFLATIADQQRQLKAKPIGHVTEVSATSTELNKKYNDLFKSYTQIIKEKSELQGQVDSLLTKKETIWKERAQLLQVQVRSHYDDFQAEREEKLQAIREKRSLEEELHRVQTELQLLHHRRSPPASVHTICRICHNISVNDQRTIERRNSSPRLISRGANIFCDNDLVVDNTPTLIPNSKGSDVSLSVASLSRTLSVLDVHDGVLPSNQNNPPHT